MSPDVERVKALNCAVCVTLTLSFLGDVRVTKNITRDEGFFVGQVLTLDYVTHEKHVCKNKFG